MQKMTDMYDVDMTELVHSFQDACADKEFRNYLNSLNINDEILMKYTSSLEDAFEECKNCKNCKNLDNCKNKVSGFVYTPYKDKNIITFSYQACEKKEEEIKRNAYKENLELFDMPKSIAEASLKTSIRMIKPDYQ